MTILCFGSKFYEVLGERVVKQEIYVLSVLLFNTGKRKIFAKIGQLWSHERCYFRKRRYDDGL